MVSQISELLELHNNVDRDKRPDYIDRHLKIYYYVFHMHSPYAEVRESISNVDDPSMPVETFRAYFIGFVLGGFFSCLNQASHPY
jgi:hypothetical protein